MILRSQADWLHLYTYETGINIEINYFDLKITRKNSVTMTPTSRRHNGNKSIFSLENLKPDLCVIIINLAVKNFEEKGSNVHNLILIL